MNRLAPSRAGSRAVLRMGALLTFASMATGCVSGPDNAGDSHRLSSRGISEPTCSVNQVWVGNDGGCLTPAQIERWKTSECNAKPFADCRALRFPQRGESARFKHSRLDQWSTEEPGTRRSRATRTADERAARWECSYAPTYDQNWHNDVWCTNGLKGERPYLLRNDAFVTQAEIMAAALDYQARLNGRP